MVPLASSLRVAGRVANWAIALAALCCALIGALSPVREQLPWSYLTLALFLTTAILWFCRHPREFSRFLLELDRLFSEEEQGTRVKKGA